MTDKVHAQSCKKAVSNGLAVREWVMGASLIRNTKDRIAFLRIISDPSTKV